MSERGIDICHETVRFWWNRFGPMFAAEIRRRRIQSRCYSQCRWHVDEVFVRISGDTYYLWRALIKKARSWKSSRRNAPGSQGGADVSQARGEALRPAAIAGHRPASVVSNGNQDARHHRPSGMWPVA